MIKPLQISKPNIQFTQSLRWLMAIWMIPLWLSVATSAYAENKASTLLVVGDSLSAAFGIPWDAGWVQLLGTQYRNQDWNVVNAGITGDTTGGGLARLPALLNEHKPKLVLIELGANDGLRGYPLKSIENNLQQMIAMAQAQKAQVVLIGMLIPPNYGKRYTDGFSAIYASLATRYNIPLVPFLLNNVATRPELMQADGLHPKQEAQPIILNTVLDVIAPLLKSQSNKKSS